MHLIFSLLLFCTSTLFTPGPNNIMIMTSGVNYGMRRSIPHYLGISLGFPLMVMLVGLGLSNIFLKFHALQEVIKIAGVCYILFLAWKIATTKTDGSDVTETICKPMTFLQAAAFQWSNPKAWVMVISAFSAYAFIGNSVISETFIVTFSFFVVVFFSTGLWLFFGLGLQNFLKEPKARRYFNYTMALLLVLSVVLIFVK